MELYLKVALTNLAQYNDGSLNFNWIDCDGNTDWDDEFQQLGMTLGEDEYFISDYDSNLPSGFIHNLGEYPQLDYLDEIGSEISGRNVNEKTWDAFIDLEGDSIRDLDDLSNVIEKMENGEIHFFPDCYTKTDLAQEFIDLYEGGIENLDDKTLINHFDFHQYGYDSLLDDPDEELDARGPKEDVVRYAENKIDEIYGGVDYMDREELERYFDYNSYGQDLVYEYGDAFVNGGYLLYEL